MPIVLCFAAILYDDVTYIGSMSNVDLYKFISLLRCECVLDNEFIETGGKRVESGYNSQSSHRFPVPVLSVRFRDYLTSCN